jgi:hypothetical protein
LSSASATSAQYLDGQVFFLEVYGIDAGYLKFTPRRGLYRRCYVTHLLVVEIKPGDGVIALRRLRFFLDGKRTPVLVELDDTIALRIVHVISEHGGAASPCRCAANHSLQVVSVEYVVAQY